MDQPLTKAELEAILQRVRTLHDTIAAHTFPRGGILHCDTCNHTREFTTQDAARFFKTAWPRHHGHTMLATAHQISDKQ